MDAVANASGATSDAYENSVNSLFEGIKTIRSSLSSAVGKTEEAISSSVQSATKAIEGAPAAVSDAVHKAEDAVKHALDHPQEKPPAGFEGGAELHTRDASSYASLEVAAADTPTGGSSPKSAVTEAIRTAEEKVEEFVEEVKEAVKHALDHPQEKPSAEFEGGAELHTRGPESYVSLEVAAADTPSGKSQETPSG